MSKNVTQTQSWSQRPKEKEKKINSDNSNPPYSNGLKSLETPLKNGCIQGAQWCTELLAVSVHHGFVVRSGARPPPYGLLRNFHGAVRCTAYLVRFAPLSALHASNISKSCITKSPPLKNPIRDIISLLSSLPKKCSSPQNLISSPALTPKTPTKATPTSQPRS